MSTKLLMAAVVAAFSFGAMQAQAQDATANEPQTTAQTQTNATSPSTTTDDNAYGGTRAKGDSGSMSMMGRPRLQDCVGPASFCDIYKGQ